MDHSKIPERSQVPEEFTWNLKDMFPSDEAWFQGRTSWKSGSAHFTATPTAKATRTPATAFTRTCEARP